MDWQQSQRSRQYVTQQAIALLVDLHEVPITRIVRLACCSSSCRSLLQAWCKRMAYSLLPRAVRETASMHQRSPKKAISAIKWVAAAVGRETCEDSTISETVISIPAVPRDIAMCLMTRGLSITHKQLVEAAKRQVAGVEVWVTASNPNLDLLVKACCSNTLELVEASHLPALLQLRPQDFADLLYITFNLLEPAAAEEIMQRLQRPATEAAWQMTRTFRQDLQSKLDRLKGFLFARLFAHLLHTAAIRGHMNLIEQLCKYKVAGLKFDPDTLVQTLQAVLKHPERFGIVSAVRRLDAAKSLPTDALHGFIKTTVTALAEIKHAPLKSDTWRYYRWQTLRSDLAGLIALWQSVPRPTASLVDVIKIAVKSSSTAALLPLQSVIKVLPADSMQDLLTCILQQRRTQEITCGPLAHKCLRILTRSEAASAVLDESVAQLLQQAMEARDGEFVQVLCEGLPQVYDVLVILGEQLMLMAVLQRDSKTARVINEVTDMMWWSVQLAFAAAVRTGQHSVLFALDDKADSRQTDIDRAFVLAIQLRKQRVLEYFVLVSHLNQGIETGLYELLLPALSAAVQCDNLPALKLLSSAYKGYNLGPYASEFDAVMLLAIALGKQKSLNMLCNTRWARQLSIESKISLLEAARSRGLETTCLWLLGGGGQMGKPGTGLLGRLEHAKRSWRALGLRGCDLDRGLSDVDPFFLSSMLQVLAANMPATAGAAEAATGQAVSKPNVLSLPGIQQLKPESLGRILLAAVRLQAVSVVQQLCTLPAAGKICSEDAAHLLEQAIDVHYSGWPSYSYRDHQGRIMHCISRLPCVQSLGHSWLIGCMHAAVQHRGDVAVDIVTQLPAAQDFSTQQALQLLHSALVQCSSHIFTRLCSLPGARGLTLDNLVTLLNAGLTQYQRSVHVQPLSDLLHSLPLAKQYWRSKDTIETLLDVAVHELSDKQQVIEVMQCLLHVPDLEYVPLSKHRHRMIRALEIDVCLELHDLKTVRPSM